MNRSTSNTLLAIASGLIAVGGLILLAVSIFGNTKDNWTLNYALAAIILSNLFNLIRIQRKRKEEEKSSDGKELEEQNHE